MVSNNNNQLCASFCFRSLSLSLSLSLSFFFLSDVFVLLAEERGGVRFYRGRLLFGNGCLVLETTLWIVMMDEKSSISASVFARGGARRRVRAQRKRQ